ncbi:MAG: wax ester/triacylglycerol synthase family O-acyltransferase [Steroidobacteraceae bacterium]|nr:wax ester/triacylglycerol synthase family O-acyltransferase [Steroidobacteraceae bacterium]
MHQLSGTDNVMLIGERRNIYNHVASLIIYDVTTAPGGKVRFRDILQHYEQRLYLHPVFRRRLVTVPLNLDRPYWVTETDIDVEYHIRHIALPKPGDWRQLMIQVARLHSRPLDRSRPLWEAYVIEGLDNIPKLPPGAFAIFLKIHHAIVDGMAAVHLTRQLHEATPEPVAVTEPSAVVVGDREPSRYEFISRGLANQVERTTKVLRMSGAIAGRMLEFGLEQLPKVAGGDITGLTSKLSGALPPAAPHTRFSEAITTNRVVEGFGMPISRIKRIRAKVPGSTLNDVFVAVAGGAARKYLLGKRELPDESLLGLMPISLRSDGASGGNHVAGFPVRVRSDIADPIERLQAVHVEARTSKDQAEAMGLDTLMNLLDVMPPFAAHALFNRLLVSRINMTVSNVRGPDEAMYLAGAKAMCMYPVSIPVDGCGLNFTGVSYNGVMWISMVSCRSMVPDPGVMLDCMRGAWEELLAAADALPAPGGHAPAGAQPGRKAGAKAGKKPRASSKRKSTGTRKARSGPAAGASTEVKPGAARPRRKAGAAAPGKRPATRGKRRPARAT